MIISENQIKIDSAKLEGIRNWPALTTVKQVWSFLGFENFYRKFTRHYADIVWPLNNLMKKDLVWNWTDTCQEAFEKLKEEFQKAPVLLMPDLTKPFVIESDTSKFATRAVIWQKDMNRDYHLCGYISHSFDTIQQNYKIYDQELMGIVVMTFSYSELLRHLFYSSLWPDHSWLILYNILTALSVSLTVDFLLIDYFSLDYSSWLITYDTLSLIDLVCAPDPLVYKPSIQTVFFSFDLG